MTLKGGAKKQFYNPILQNRAHVNALAAHLGLPAGAFRSYIVFSERCELKAVPPDTDEYAICQRQRLLKTLRKDMGQRQPLFDATSFNSLESKLDALAADSTNEAREAHVEEARKVASGEVCPRCGSKLVQRNGKYGSFMGCSAYPKCRYTRDL